MYESFVEELQAYTRTRFRPGVYVPLAVFLCAASAIGAQAVPWDRIAAAVLTSLALLLQFRVWDDLADRHRDAVEHPDRVLPVSQRVGQYRWLVTAMAMMNTALVMILGTLLHVMVFALVNLTFFAWYGLLREHVTHQLLRSHAVLLKYPAFVFVLSGIVAVRSPLYLGYSMLITYFAICIYEIVHDPALQRDPRSLPLLAAETAVVVLAPIGLFMFNTGSSQ